MINHLLHVIDWLSSFSRKGKVMAIGRPETFEEFSGHKQLVKHLLDRIHRGTLSQYILFYGEEGLGKTTLIKLIAMALSCRQHNKPCGKCESCIDIKDRVIRKNLDTDNVVTFKMSVEGTKESVKDVLASMNKSFLDEGVPKIIILEECHGMEDSAQNALLSDLEYLPEGVYVFMATTDISRLSKSLLSRFVMRTLNRLSKDELIQLLNRESARRGITVQGGKATLELISEWSEYKPRTALNVLEAFGNGSNVSIDDVKDHIGFIDIRDVITIISSLGVNGSLTTGLFHINELQMGPSTHSSLITVLTEAVKIAHGAHSTKLTNEDFSHIRTAVREVDVSKLIQLLYDVCAVRDLTRPFLIASYLKIHHQGLKVSESISTEVLTDERKYMVENSVNESPQTVDQVKAPTMGSLLKNAKLIE